MAALRARMTASSVSFSCAAYALTVSTRFGMRSIRRFSCTSICDQEFSTWLRERISPL